MNDNRNVGGLLDELRAVLDARADLAAKDAPLATRRLEIEIELLRIAEAQGVESFANDAMSVSVKEDLKACYDADCWPAIVRWAVENGHDFIIQRRLTDAKVASLVSEGVALPAGLRLDPYKRLLTRRK